MRIAVIGCGNMGEAILGGIHKKHVVCVSESRKDRQQYLKKKYRTLVLPVDEAVRAAELVILAVKPQDMGELLAEVSRLPLKGKLFVSIAAGLTTRFIEKSLKQNVRVVRVMPNLPAMIGEGVSGISGGKRSTPADIKAVTGIFRAVGEVVVVKESKLDAVTAVSGSGPAYVFLFVECLVQAAKRLGFSGPEARTLVYGTLLGSAHLLAKSSDSAEILRQKVTSKGGTTQAATDVFMKKNVFRIYCEALQAARRRAKELSK